MNLFDKERREVVLPFAGQGRKHKDDHVRIGDGVSHRQGLFEKSGSDEVPGTTSVGETLTGTDGDDQLIGGRGDDIIEGGDGNDYLIGGAGRDEINGGDGDDYIADGWGTGSMDGGDGIDTVDVSHSNTGAVIDLVAGTIDWEGHSPTEIAINFENVIGSNGNNTIIGTSGANRLEGRGGDDTLIGGGGNDTLYGGTGRSTYVYNLGDGSDVIYNGAAGKDHGQDGIVFGAGITAADVTITHVGADLILTLTDGETLTLKDYDTYPVEVLEFADGSTQDISSYQPQDWTGRRKTWFTSGRDNHFGGEGDDTLNGRSGHDQLHGGGGDDTLLGGSGNDGLFGGAGDDRIDGGSGRDTIYGDAGDDWISGGYGVDHMDGDAGNDTLDYAYS
ncbi:MAG TPA: calcium-binding protein, partial [Roseibacterium sp.]|nr:calcium-binding protein [Roseibacterium sp.]